MIYFNVFVNGALFFDLRKRLKKQQRNKQGHSEQEQGDQHDVQRSQAVGNSGDVFDNLLPQSGDANHGSS